MSEQYLIWSNQHDAWWKPDRWGYTDDVRKAGRYSKDEAADICVHANRHCAKDWPDEIMLPESALAHLLTAEASVESSPSQTAGPTDGD